ncbi:hypothetical protein [Klebsiella variicola]
MGTEPAGVIHLLRKWSMMPPAMAPTVSPSMMHSAEVAAAKAKP